MTNAPNRWIKRKWKQLKRTFPNRCHCQKCKNAPPSKLEFAHVRATALSHGAPRGRKEKYYDITNHPASYKLMLPSCHREKFAGQHRRFRREAAKQ